jgi:NADH-quinone oxidoreductase subunit L
VYFRVFEGPVEYHPGDEHHGGAADEAHGHETPHQAEAEHIGGQDAGHFHPHAPGLAISLVLVVLALASFAAIPLVYSDEGWMSGIVRASTAAIESHEHSGTFLGWKPHEGVMYVASAIVGVIGIAAAWWLHLAGRTSAAVSRADRLVPALGPVPRWAQNKWYVDELYNFLFYVPLRVLSHILHIFDKLLVDGLVNAFGAAPRGAGYAIRPTQNGLLHAYALRMVGGIGLLLLVVLALMGGTR